MDYLDEIKKEFPEIKRFEEDDDYWEQEGYDWLKVDNFKMAESVFKKLCLSQPEHHGGFEGLAYVYYSTKEKEKALWFMNRALSLARAFLKDESIDIEVIQEMEANLKKIEEDKDLVGWWC